MQAKFPFELFDREKDFVIIDEDRGKLLVLVELSGSPQKRQLNCVATITTPWFSKITKDIFPTGIVDTLFCYASYLYTPESGVVSEQDVDDMVKFFINWFEEKVIESNILECLSEFNDKYTSYELEIYTSETPLGSQRNFIIINTLKGKVAKLTQYHNGFLEGDRKGFAPLIKLEHFERAVELAKKYESGELISPIEF